jgi:MarR family transcriptional regulator, organic hydroperoxide resistance regulator
MSESPTQYAPKEKALETLKLFRVIFKTANKHFTQIEKTVGIGGASLWALAEIEKTEAMTISQLSRAMSIHQSTASNLIESLESKGLVEKIRCTKDKRVIYFKVTHLGKTQLAKAPLPHIGILPDALSRMDDDDLKLPSNTQQQLINHMHHQDASSAFEPLGIVSQEGN